MLREAHRDWRVTYICLTRSLDPLVCIIIAAYIENTTVPCTFYKCTAIVFNQRDLLLLCSIQLTCSDQLP